MVAKRKPNVDVYNTVPPHVQRELEFAFQERTAIFAESPCFGLGSFDDANKVIGISQVCNREFPLPILAKGDGTLLLDAEVPRPAVEVARQVNF